MLKSPSAIISAVRGPKPVMKILSLWEPSEGQGMDGMPSRGFAGQILFFTHGSATPIPVHGVVKIHQYANYDPDQPDPTPVHTFTFDDGAWNAHAADGTLGHSYNVFLPFQEEKPAHVVCALRVEITAPDGRMISSPFTEVTLPGRAGKFPGNRITNVSKPDVDAIRSASATTTRSANTTGAAKPVQKLESTTIPLPKKL
ncbi:MAG: hypothetical protein KDA89_05905 [Planctomycetaceae bacterium]|nr:hypothetical protein [Planctomycetaceae bacterium]